MCIPKNAQNSKLAHEFINYMLTYDAAYSNSDTVGYTSNNQEVLDDMSAEGGIMQIILLTCHVPVMIKMKSLFLIKN